VFLQNFARRFTIPIDEIVFDFEFIDSEPEVKPKDGAYVYGLFIEGAKWNYQKMELDESDPKASSVSLIHYPIQSLETQHLQNYKENININYMKTIQIDG